MRKKLQDLLNLSKYMIEIIWNEGELTHIDASHYQIPLFPTYHQGGKVIVSDGNYEGIASFGNLASFPIALKEAETKLASKRFVALTLQDYLCGEKLIDNYWPKSITLDGILNKLGELRDRLCCITDDDFIVLTSTIDSSKFYYLNSLGAEYIRYQYYSTISLEILHSGQLRSTSSISRKSYQQHVDIIRPELIDLVIRRDRYCESFKAGEYPILFSHSAAGIFIHEVVGHLFEADTYTAQQLKARISEQIAPSFLSIGDYPVYACDDEGVRTGKTWMILEGKIENLLHSRETARIYGEIPNGHGKSMYGSEKALPRMNRTILQEGEASQEELRRAFKHTIFVKSIDNAHSYKGSFVLHVRDAELMENGESICYLGKLVIRGDCMKALSNVLLIGDQIREDFFTCGKQGQNGLKVSAVSPEILVKSLWIGVS